MKQRPHISVFFVLLSVSYFYVWSIGCNYQQSQEFYLCQARALKQTLSRLEQNRLSQTEELQAQQAFQAKKQVEKERRAREAQDQEQLDEEGSKKAIDLLAARLAAFINPLQLLIQATVRTTSTKDGDGKQL